MTNFIVNQAQTQTTPGLPAVRATRRRCGVMQHTPQIAELDCNPFVVDEQGGQILAARVRITEIEPKPLVGAAESSGPFL